MYFRRLRKSKTSSQMLKGDFPSKYEVIDENYKDALLRVLLYRNHLFLGTTSHEILACHINDLRAATKWSFWAVCGALLE